jgi:hypothetical protein
MNEKSGSRRRLDCARLASAVGILVAALILGHIGAAQGASDGGGGALTVSIISPANGGGAPGQTLQAGVFAITNNSSATQMIKSVTITFSRASLFSSASLKPPTLALPLSQNVTGNPSAPVTASPPAASTTFSFNEPIGIAPGAQRVFALEVTMSPVSRNEPDNVRYASILPESYAPEVASPLWILLALIGLITAALSERAVRRAWLIAGLLILLCIGAPGCGSDSDSPLSRQMVTSASASTELAGVVERNTVPIITGLPLDIGTIFGR